MSASDSGERKSIGEKTHISLRSAIVIVFVAVIPLTAFIGNLSFGISELKTMMAIEKEQREKQSSWISIKVEDHEVRIRDLEKHKP